MLTRELISSGRYLEQLGTLPAEWLWTPEKIRRSYEETMRVRPDTGDVWLFGYGSLIWNPLLDFHTQQGAVLEGWRRSFCLRMFAGRAHAGAPGRMLALEPGGRVQGVAFHIAADKLEQELPMVWVREMVAGSYLPVWQRISLADGQQVHALVFVANQAAAQYDADASIATVAPLIANASGVHGSNADYVFRLSFALADRGFTDDYIEAMTFELQRICSDRGRTAGRNLP